MCSGINVASECLSETELGVFSLILQPLAGIFRRLAKGLEEDAESDLQGDCRVLAVDEVIDHILQNVPVARTAPDFVNRVTITHILRRDLELVEGWIVVLHGIRRPPETNWKLVPVFRREGLEQCPLVGTLNDSIARVHQPPVGICDEGIAVVIPKCDFLLGENQRVISEIRTNSHDGS